MCKSAVEIEVMKKAAKATEAGMKAGIDAARAGVTENEIAGEISRAMFDAGGEAPAVMPYVTSGPRTMIGHATWEGRDGPAGRARLSRGRRLLSPLSHGDDAHRRPRRIVRLHAPGPGAHEDGALRASRR